MSDTDKATSATTTDKGADGFTDEERAAIRERAKELRTERRSRGKADDEAALLQKIAEMPEADRAMAERIHEIVLAASPGLAPKLWYGMPGYAKDGKVVVFFQGSAKFKTRYATLGFNEQAQLDEGTMWPTAYAITQLTPDAEERITELVRRAAG